MSISDRPTRPTVAYTSRYGSTARYARALASRLDTSAVELARRPDPATLGSGGGALVVVTPIYASRPYRRGRVLAALRSGRGTSVPGAPGRPTALVLVGMSPLDDDERLATARRTVAALADGPAPAVFHLRGAYDPRRLGLLHRLMMTVARRNLRGSDDPGGRAMAAGESVDLVDDAALEPIVEWAGDGRAASPHAPD